MPRHPAAHLPGADQAQLAAAPRGRQARLADQPLDGRVGRERRRAAAASTTCARSRPRSGSCPASRCSGRSTASTSTGIDWVIAGGESGPRLPADGAVDWARGIRDACQDAGVPFFFKQWGGRTPKAVGRELDGRLGTRCPRPLRVRRRRRPVHTAVVQRAEPAVRGRTSSSPASTISSAPNRPSSVSFASRRSTFLVVRIFSSATPCLANTDPMILSPVGSTSRNHGVDRMPGRVGELSGIVVRSPTRFSSRHRMRFTSSLRNCSAFTCVSPCLPQFTPLGCAEHAIHPGCAYFGSGWSPVNWRPRGSSAWPKYSHSSTLNPRLFCRHSDGIGASPK